MRKTVTCWGRQQEKMSVVQRRLSWEVLEIYKRKKVQDRRQD